MLGYKFTRKAEPHIHLITFCNVDSLRTFRCMHGFVKCPRIHERTTTFRTKHLGRIQKERTGIKGVPIIAISSHLLKVILNSQENASSDKNLTTEMKD